MSQIGGEGQRRLPELAAPDALDPVIEAYKKDIDRTLLRENLKLTIEQRLQKAEGLHRSIDLFRGAARKERTQL